MENQNRIKEKKFLGAVTRRALALCSVIAVTLSASSCSSAYNSATGRKELSMINIAQEEKIGLEINKQVFQKYQLSGRQSDGERVYLVGKRIVSAIKRRGIQYKFGVVKDANLNAFTIPGGYVYVTSGLLANISNDDELAAVLSHEIGHSEARHAVKHLEAALSYSAVMQLAYVLDRRPEDKKGNWKYLKSGSDVVFNLINLGYSRRDEYKADWLSIGYMDASGYAPKAILTVMQKLKAKESAGDAKWMQYFRSHPYLDERMSAVSEELSRGSEVDIISTPSEQPAGKTSPLS